jgi:hypothetical protein
MTRMALRISEAVFLRLSAGDPSWLTELRWPADILTMLDAHHRLAEQETKAESALGSWAPGFSTDAWASLQTWMRRAVLKPSTNEPRLLQDHGEAARAFRTLIDIARQRVALDSRLDVMLDEHESLLQNVAFRRLSDPAAWLLATSASTDVSFAIARLAGEDLAPKDRRRLARTLWALLARSTYKSCPLAFAADTGIILLRGVGETCIQVGSAPYLLIRPNQELANELIRQLHPLEGYLADGKHALHLNAAAKLDGERLRIWRSTLDGHSVRESLAEFRLPSSASALLGALTDTGFSPPPGTLLSPSQFAVVRKLVAEGILVREDLVTPADGDPWTTVARAAAEAANRPGGDLPRQVQEVQRQLEHYRRPRLLQRDDTNAVVAGLSAIRKLGHEVIGPDKIASASASVDTFRTVHGDISSRDSADVRHAVEQYFALAALAYPLTPTFRRRQAFIDFFRSTYGTDRPVHVESMLIDHWDTVNRTLSFLLDPGDSPIHPDSDLVWPEPSAEHGLYAAFYEELQSSAASRQASVRLGFVSTDLPLLGQCQPVMDAICRLGRRQDGRLDVLVESATFSGRLVARHLDAVSGLDRQALAAAEHYRSEAHRSGRERPRAVSAGIVASHAVPRLQNLSAMALGEGPVLALSEPVPALPAEMLIRYGDLHVRFDSGEQGFVVTRGRESPAVTFSWPSPLSPSFSRRLHLLRFLSLAAEPVLTAPRWLAAESSRAGRMPRVSVGQLVLSPQRWAVPIEAFAACPDATGPRRHYAVSAVHRDYALPDEAFVYTAGDTRPSYIDFASPFAADVFLRLIRQAHRDGSRTVLVEERFPLPGREVIDSPSGSASLVFQCTLSPDSPTVKGSPC